MKNLFTILFISLFIFSCNSGSNPMEPLSCSEGLTEIDGQCVDGCGIINGDNIYHPPDIEDVEFVWE